MCKIPNFFLIGAPKAGTSSLFHYICQHPQVFGSRVKETHFLCNEEKYARGVDWYLNRYFSGAEDYPARGEATPHYLRFVDVVPSRLREMVETQSVQLVVILRDPVERAWSHYLFRRSHKVDENESFQVLFEREVKKWDGTPETGGYYFYPGLYGFQIERWLKYFPRDSFLFLKLDHLKSRPQKTVQKVFRFLGISYDIKVDTSKRKNVTGKPRFHFIRKMLRNIPKLRKLFKLIVPLHFQHQIQRRMNNFFVESYNEGKPQISDETAKELKEYYYEDINRVEKLTGLDIS